MLLTEQEKNKEIKRPKVGRVNVTDCPARTCLKSLISTQNISRKLVVGQVGHESRGICGHAHVQYEVNEQGRNQLTN